MRNTKLITILLLIFSLSLVTSAQQKEGWKDKSPQELAEKRADRLKEKLSLTNEQHKQLYDILLSSITEMKSLREEIKKLKEQKSTIDDNDKKAMREKIKTLRKETHDKIMNILTPEQKTKLDELKENRKEWRKNKKHHHEKMKKHKERSN